MIILPASYSHGNNKIFSYINLIWGGQTLPAKILDV